jgi:hypothetical protein
MDPQTYCRHGCAALLADPGGDHEAIQRAAVLAHFATRELSGPDFARELKELWQGAVRDRRPALADAARAVLREWEGGPAA